MKISISIVALIFFQNITFSQNTWYVRPAFSGMTYGNENDTTYADAWNGLEVLNGKFQDGTIGDTDEIYICGTHIFHDTTGINPIALQGKIGIKSGQDSISRLTIRGDYPGDLGVIWGHARMDHESWVDRGNNVWSIYLHASYRWNWYFQDIETTGVSNPIILKPVNSIAEVENTPGSTYSIDYTQDSIYVHLTDGGNPNNRVYAPWYGYSFDFDNYINTFSPLHNITFKNLSMHGMGISSNQNYSHIRWDGCTFAWSPGDAIRFFKDQDYNEILNCDIGWCANGVYGIDDSNTGGANHILIKGNYFHDIGSLDEHQNSDEHAVGMQGGTDWIIEENYIEKCGSGPLIYAFTNQLLTNTIIRYNFIKDCDPDGSATGYGIATQCNNNSFSNKNGNKIYNNIVVNCKVGIRLQFEDMQDCFNNTIYKCKSSFVSGRNYNGEGARINLRNNISAMPDQYHINWFSGATDFVLDSDYALYQPDSIKFYFAQSQQWYHDLTDWQLLTWDSCIFDPNSIIGDPLFENATGTFSEPTDFILTASSPAINAGTDVGLNSDYAGSPIVDARDIGAYEFQNPLTIEDYDQKDFLIFPNPTTCLVNLVFPKEMQVNIVVSDIRGKQLFQKKIYGELTNFDLYYLPNGIYLVSIQTSDQIAIKKLILQR